MSLLSEKTMREKIQKKLSISLFNDITKPFAELSNKNLEEEFEKMVMENPFNGVYTIVKKINIPYEHETKKNLIFNYLKEVVKELQETADREEYKLDVSNVIEKKEIKLTFKFTIEIIAKLPDEEEEFFF